MVLSQAVNLHQSAASRAAQAQPFGAYEMSGELRGREGGAKGRPKMTELFGIISIYPGGW